MASISRGNYVDINVNTEFLTNLSRQTTVAAAYMRDAADYAGRANRYAKWDITANEREAVDSEIRQIKAHSKRIADYLESLSGILKSATSAFENEQTQTILTMKSIVYKVD